VGSQPPSQPDPTPARTPWKASGGVGVTRGNPFAHLRYQFATGVPAGDLVPIRSEPGDVVLCHRSFASITGTVASLVSAIILAAGAASALFLVAEKQVLGASAAVMLTAVFALFVAMMVPRINVALYQDTNPVLTLWQQSIFPSSSWLIATAEGTPIALLRRSLASRMGWSRWTITQDGRYVGELREVGYARAILRKALGKFSRRYETDMVIEYGGLLAACIIRRPGASGNVDVLEIISDTLDRRLAVGAAAIVFGREP
jgi:hypothetical protein